MEIGRGIQGYEAQPTTLCIARLTARAIEEGWPHKQRADDVVALRKPARGRGC